MWRKLQWWLRRREIENDFEEEIRSHLAIEGGDARKTFGNVARIQEETRDAWGWTALEHFLNDMRHGLRMLRRTPGWTAVMSATLALGIGLATAIFSVVYSVLLQPLPYPQPDRLVSLWSTYSAPGAIGSHFNIDAKSWGAVRAQSKLFEDIALIRPVANFNLTGSGEPERLQGARTMFNVPAVLGVRPLLGRTWTDAEDRADASVAVLSYSLWERRFGKDPSILGRKIELNGGPFEIIGVMPPEYLYPTRDFELWTPLFVPPVAIEGRFGDFNAVARLRPGASLAQAQQEITAIMDRDPTAAANGYRLGLFAESFLDSAVGPVKDVLWTLLEAVGGLLLIGCLSLGGLLVARAGARVRELSVRAALGADIARLRRQMLAETLPLTAAGIVGGVTLAWALVQSFRAWLPATMPRAEAIALHLPVFAFAAAVSFAVVLLAAILPAFLAGRAGLSQAIRSNSRSVTSGGSLRQWLVTAQIAVTLAILFGGGLLVRSLAAQLAVQPGFETEGVLTMHLAVTRAKYPKDDQISAYCDRIVSRIKTLPGVAEAGFVNRLPLSGTGQVNPVEFEGRPDLGVISTSSRSATPGYFSAMRIPLLRGRVFTSGDTPGGPNVGLIDELLAKRAFGASDPVGKRFRFTAPNIKGPWVEIVGVIGHIRNEGPEQDNRPQVYWPHSQRAQDRGALVVRTLREPSALASAVIGQIRLENPDQAVYDVRSLDAWMSRVMQTRTLMTGLVAAFAGAALLLACLGLYGVVAYNASLRMREFGLRLALGAANSSIRALVLRQASRLVGIGTILGLLAAWPVGRAIRNLLFEVPPADVLSLAAAAILLAAVALIAALGPAIRASRADPSSTLRAD